MTAATEPVVAPPARERGWGRVAFATLALLIVPLTPLVRVLLPVEQTALLLAPALGALAVAGWLAGGRPALAIVWVAIAAWSVSRLSGAGMFAVLQGGWALLVAASFGVLAVLARWSDRPFLTRALVAIGASLAIAGAVTVVVPGGPARIADAVAAESGRRADRSRAEWRQLTSSPEWQEFAAANPQAGELGQLVDQQITTLPVTARTLFPSLVALEALATLALAWALYHRLGRARVGPPLADLRDFRFSDHLVWGVVGGLGLLLLPGVAILRAIGANLLVFFGALYTLRGVGVFLWMASPGRFASALLVLMALLFWNFLGVMALGLGVGDTWLDWRARARARKT